MSTTKPQVTIIVVPRERFSYTRESLESIYRCNNSYPFDLVYVDGNSPRHIQNYLAQQAKSKRFKLIRVNNYLSPNQARNIGLQVAETKYVVFMDNDLHVAPGWLEKLVNCAEEELATVVCPLVRQLSFGGYATWLEKMLVAGERKVNRAISDRYHIEH